MQNTRFIFRTLQFRLVIVIPFIPAKGSTLSTVKPLKYLSAYCWASCLALSSVTWVCGLAILDLLRAGPRCVYEIADSTSLSQPNTSAHLACLEECGLVQKEKRGKFIYYRMAHREAITLLNQAETILAKVGDHIFRCTRYEANGRKRKK